ncbi:hypothetical protein QVD17_11676 [Tagetes erecta]|uniref:Reverse transcriptase zinc-binding domain-containing protein n=1 Tax=Tagetes erecta TaxID=13708 RepID=A0AAD8P299_TARER|nr:hypothetical protein QVD17_11676 [Tagetes erecta]
MIRTESGIDWRWNWSRRPALGMETRQFQQLFSLLQGFRVSETGDKWTWEADDEEAYTIKSLKKTLELNRIPADPNPMKWANGVPLKVKGFIWKARLDRIPTKVALTSRGVQVGSEECSFCFGNYESSEHLLLHCLFATMVWNKIARWCGWSMPLFNSVRECMDSYSDITGSNSKKETMAVILKATVWYIWLVFNSSTPSVDGVVDKVRVNTFFWLKHRARKINVVWHKWCSNPLL